MKKLISELPWTTFLITLFLLVLSIAYFYFPEWAMMLASGVFGFLVILAFANAWKKNPLMVIILPFFLPLLLQAQETQSTSVELLYHLFGDITLATWLSAGIFSMLGFTLNLGLGVAFRNKKSPDSPEKFSWRYFTADNRRRFWWMVAISFIVVFITFRFYNEWTGKQLGMQAAFIMGFSIDYLIMAFKNRNFGTIQKIFQSTKQ